MDFKKYIELYENTNISELFNLDSNFLNELGLFHKIDDEKQFIGLFKNSDSFKNGISHLTNPLTSESELNDLDKKSLETVNKEILGCATIIKNTGENCFQVERIHADGTYEPFLYFILMELTKIGLMPKSKNVSEKARNMWKNFFDGKYGDSVAKALLKHENYPGVNFLNCKYALHQPIGANKLLQNYNDILKDSSNSEVVNDNLFKLFKKSLENLNPIFDDN